MNKLLFLTLSCLAFTEGFAHASTRILWFYSGRRRKLIGGTVVLRIAKNRNGPLGSVILSHHGPLTSFYEYVNIKDECDFTGDFFHIDEKF